MRELQDEYWRLDDRLLDNERALSRLEKIEHLRRLAQARTALEALGPEDLLARYRALLPSAAGGTSSFGTSLAGGSALRGGVSTGSALSGGGVTT